MSLLTHTHTLLAFTLRWREREQEKERERVNSEGGEMQGLIRVMVFV